MYSILIVDDRTLIRKGLIKMIDWEALNAELAGEAENGNRAIEIIDEKNPDIVITDIRMPDCDGISLLNTLAAEHPRLKTIVVSGYDDFEYARTALKCGSLDYLLKPVDPAELNRVIKNACVVIRNEKSSLSANSDGESALYRLIHGRESGETAVFPPGSEGCYFAVAVFRIPGDISGLKEIKTELEDLFIFKGVESVLDSRELAVVFYDSRDEGEASFANRVFHAVKNRVFTQVPPQGSVAGIGKTVENYLEAGNSYNSACEALSYVLLNADERVFTHYKTVSREFINVPIEQFEHALEADIIAGNPESARAVLKSIYDAYFRLPLISLESVQLAVSKLCHIIIRLDAGLSRKIQEFLDKMAAPGDLYEFGRMENIEYAVTDFYVSASEWFREDNNAKYATSKRIREYIEKNYASDINLKFIAGHFRLNPSYLSFLFKQETNENINEFINKTIIEKAKRILETGGARVSQVSRLVGFSDENYFYRVFKRVTGLTPGEFQETQKKYRE